MSKIATIKRAIEKLEQLKLESTKGPWQANQGYFGDDWAPDLGAWIPGVAGVYRPVGAKVPPFRNPGDADLIVTLHRTIEPQLSLLRLAVKYGELDAGSGSSFIAAAHDLALSILEETNE